MEINPNTMKRLTKLEILNETVDFYSADPKRRSYCEDYGCTYNGKNDTHCAVGRCLLPEYQKQGTELKGNTATIAVLEKSNGIDFDALLQEKYRGHEMGFWKRLQILHDESSNWNKSGISFEGELAVNKIIEVFELNKN